MQGREKSNEMKKRIERKMESDQKSSTQFKKNTFCNLSSPAAVVSILEILSIVLKTKENPTPKIHFNVHPIFSTPNLLT